MTLARAILLAAGSAQRLRPLTDAVPKCLLDVGGRSIVSRAVSILAAQGITRITVVDGFEGDRLRGALTSEFPPDWFDFRRNAEYADTNNAFSLRLALSGVDEPILLLDADVLFDAAVVRLLMDDSRANRLAVRTRGALGEEEMKVSVAGDGRIEDVGKRISGRAHGESVGLAIFSAAFVRRLLPVLERRLVAEGRVDEWYESAFLELIAGGESVYAIDIGDLRAIEVDTKEDLEEARRLFS
ncbi:MAG: phosphocholine cytidylyltransferase family protein [Acidobacteria bacterium]|nr:phosphocholine cytidylyltransferase family protein [Acidobacteriota bacterium]